MYLLKKIKYRIEINRKYSIVTITRCCKFPMNSNHRVTQHYRAISLKRSLDFRTCTLIIISRVSSWRKKLGRDLEQEWKRLKFGSKGTACYVTQAAERKLPRYFFILLRRAEKEGRKRKDVQILRYWINGINLTINISSIELKYLQRFSSETTDGNRKILIGESFYFLNIEIIEYRINFDFWTLRKGIILES